MGNYSYICNGCGKPICETEKVHLFHVRHGEVLGEAEGTFDGYGTVLENEGFDNNIFDKHDVDDTNINCHDEVCNSKFNFDDSVIINSERKTERLYNGKITNMVSYFADRIEEYIFKQKISKKDYLKTKEKIEEDFKKLPPAPMITPKSGVVAYHKYCFDHADKINYTPSEGDPNQGWGTPNEKYL